MSDLFTSLKSDLSSRRMLPLLGLAALALVGALAYVALAGKSGSSTPGAPLATTGHVAQVPGPAVSSAPANPNAAVSETTVGTHYQHGGKMRDPFAALKGKSHAPATTKSSVGSSGTSSASNTSSPSGGSSPTTSGNTGAPVNPGGTSTQPSESSPSTPSGTAVTLYHVDVSLQRLSEEGKPVGQPQTFTDVTTKQPLPSKSRAMVEPLVVIGEAQRVAFLLTSEAILHGSARCWPNGGDCEVIELKAGESEELQYLQPSGSVVAYRLSVTSIQKIGQTANTADVKDARPSVAGTKLIAKMHLSIPTSAQLGGSLGTIVGRRSDGRR